MATTLFDQEESTFPFAGADVDSELDEDADYYQINYDLDGRGDKIGGSSSTMTLPAPLPPLANQPAQPQKNFHCGKGCWKCTGCVCKRNGECCDGDCKCGPDCQYHCCQGVQKSQVCCFAESKWSVEPFTPPMHNSNIIIYIIILTLT